MPLDGDVIVAVKKAEYDSGRIGFEKRWGRFSCCAVTHLASAQAKRLLDLVVYLVPGQLSPFPLGPGRGI